MRKIWLKYKKETKLCPHCNKEIPKFGIQCPYCYEYIIQRGEFYERKDSKYFPKSQEEYEKMCKDLNKTIFTKGEYEEWKSKQPLFCPNY